MSGLINNANILTGLNQLIKAVNDLVLTANVQPVVNNYNSVYCTCGGSSSGTTAPTTDTTYDGTQTPPGSYTTKAVDDSACKRANFHYDALYSVVDTFIDYNVPLMAATLVRALITEITALFPNISIGGVSIFTAMGLGDVLGYVVGVAKGLVLPGVNLTDILLKLTQNKEAIVCNFYTQITEGGNVGTSIDGLIQILADAGLSLADQAVIRAIYTADWAMHLFYTRPSLEAALDGYAGSVECGGCGGEAYVVLSGILTRNGVNYGHLEQITAGQYSFVSSDVYGFQCFAVQCAETGQLMDATVNFSTTPSQKYQSAYFYNWYTYGGVEHNSDYGFGQTTDLVSFSTVSSNQCAGTITIGAAS